MAVECAEHSTTCDHCGYTLQSRDCWPIVAGELGVLSEDNDNIVWHCICYQCGEEWVE